MATKLKEHIKTIGSKFGITENDELSTVYRALEEKNDELVEDIILPKKWKQFKKQLDQLKQNSTTTATSILKFRFPLKNPPKKYDHPSVKAIIMGPCGNGKTCLVNNLCGSDLPAGNTTSSLTRDITELKSQFQYPVPFVIYDTPGTTAHVDKLEHATHLKCLLQYKPVNTVCILIKFDGRYDELINNIYRQVKMLQGYEQNIVFLVSHFDLAEKPQEALDEVDRMMSQLELENQIVYFSNKFINEKVFSDSLYSICASMPQVHIKIVEKIFFEYFNLKKQKTEELYFKNFETKLLNEMKQVAQCYQEFAVSLPNDDERDAIFQDMEITLKCELTELFDQFVDKYKTTMAITEYYTSFYTLQLRINEHVSAFQDKIRSLQKHKFIQSQATGSKLDIRDLIKKCPNPACNLIWFRIEACPNTSCGNRPSCAFDFMKKAVFRYKITRDKKSRQFKIEKSGQQKTRKDPTNTSVVNNITIEERVKKNKVGCGQNMNFETLPRLPNIEQILMQWYNVHTMEEVVKRVQEDEELERTRRELERKINSSFFGFMY